MFVEGRKSERADESENGSFTVPAAITDTGCERDLNEDRYAVIESASGVAWLVCDGMGGATGGELAAQLAIDAIRRDLENLPQRGVDAALKGAILEANRIIVLRRQNQAFAQMGTTIVAAMFSGPEVVVGHVGDSRAYVVSTDLTRADDDPHRFQARQLTIDHTYVQTLVDQGQIKFEDALSHPQAHILTRAIGSEPGLEVATQRFWVWQVAEGEPADKLVLCSDGLYSLVTDAEIAAIVSQESPKRACSRLVELARNRGGFDNITLSVIPLGGQLKKDMPLGYHEKKRSSPARIPRIEFSGPSLMRTVILTLLISGLAAIVTVLIVMLSLGRS